MQPNHTDPTNTQEVQDEAANDLLADEEDAESLIFSNHSGAASSSTQRSLQRPLRARVRAEGVTANVAVAMGVQLAPLTHALSAARLHGARTNPRLSGARPYSGRHWSGSSRLPAPPLTYFGVQIF